MVIATRASRSVGGSGLLGSRSRPLAVVAFGSPYLCQTWMRLPSPERLAHPAVVDWVGVRLSANAVPHSSLAPLLVPSALLLGWSWLRGWSGGLVSVGSSLCSGGGSFVVLPVVARGRGLAVTTQGLSGSCQTWMRLPSSERFAHPAVVGCLVGSLTVNAGPFLSGLVPPPFWSFGGSVCRRVGASAVSVSSLAMTTVGQTPFLQALVFQLLLRTLCFAIRGHPWCLSPCHPTTPLQLSVTSTEENRPCWTQRLPFGQIQSCHNVVSEKRTRGLFSGDLASEAPART